jgi:hypothetical protein
MTAEEIRRRCEEIRLRLLAKKQAEELADSMSILGRLSSPLDVDDENKDNEKT